MVTLRNGKINYQSQFKNTQYPGKYETKENAHFVLILMIKKGTGEKPDISLILHNKLTKLDMEDKL